MNNRFVSTCKIIFTKESARQECWWSFKASSSFLPSSLHSLPVSPPPSQGQSSNLILPIPPTLLAAVQRDALRWRPMCLHKSLQEGVWLTSLRAWGAVGLGAWAPVSVDTRCVLCLQNKQQYLFSSWGDGRTLCVCVCVGVDGYVYGSVLKKEDDWESCYALELSISTAWTATRKFDYWIQHEATSNNNQGWT